MDYNYHTHTFRCMHATDNERSYIQKAIEAGIRHLGFSDHAPFIFPDGHESFYRVPMRLVKDYFDTLCALREEFRDRISIHIGFEMEYYPAYFDEMLDIATRAGAEYLILGQHFIANEQVTDTRPSLPTEDPARLIEYTDCLVAAMKRGVFTYIAHPDLMRYTRDDNIYRREVERTCRAAIETNTPLEINFLGIREGRHYPLKMTRFWQIAGGLGAPVTVGFDAHNARAAGDIASLPTAMDMVKRYGLNYIGEPRLVPLQN